MDEPNVLIAIASWKSKIARDKAMRTLNANPKTKEIITKHRQYGKTYIIGNFDGPITAIISNKA